MITYNNRTWLGSLFHIEGTVLPHIKVPVAFIAAWSASVYIAQCRFPVLAGWDMKVPFVLLGKFVSFFLIFRTNGAYRRYWSSNSVLKEIQVATRELHQQYIVYVKGGREADNEKDRVEWESLAMRAKTDATRYLLAFCAAFKLHSRMAFEGYMRGSIDGEVVGQVDIDRARLRGLLTEEEFELVDDLLRIEHTPKRDAMTGEEEYAVSTEISGRACHLILYFLFCLGRDAAVCAKEWGFLERCLNLADGKCGLLMRAFEEMDQNICTPLPLPYGHLCKTLMFTFLLAFPFCLNDMENGLICNIIAPVIIAVAMFGMESISMEIEDPFGDDPNDFAVMRIITAIESSMWETMLCRNEPACANFIWVQAPQEYHDCRQFIALADEQRAVYQMAPGCSPARYRPVAITDPAHISSVLQTRTSKSSGPSGNRLWQYDKWSWDLVPG